MVNKGFSLESAATTAHCIQPKHWELKRVYVGYVFLHLVQSTHRAWDTSSVATMGYMFSQAVFLIKTLGVGTRRQ